jgi:hypothetical protein
MSQMAKTSTLEAVASLCGSLNPDHQSSLLQFARFLKSQEESNEFHEVDEEDEAEWDQLLSDPDRVAKFGQWAERSRASSLPRLEQP